MAMDFDGNDSTFESSAAFYRRCVDKFIHPEGYFRGIVDVDGAKETFAAQLSATAAMALMAEMAGQIGVDLWGYNNRGVSVITAATYTFYYYFFPSAGSGKRVSRGRRRSGSCAGDGAFYEMVCRRSPLRGDEQLFAEQRPLFSAFAGLTTLTHGLAPPRRSAGGFGRAASIRLVRYCNAKGAIFTSAPAPINQGRGAPIHGL